MSQLHFEPLHADFGATVTGIDLADELTADIIEAIDAAMDEYSLLCFPDQDMNDDAQLALTRALGDPEPNT